MRRCPTRRWSSTFRRSRRCPTTSSAISPRRWPAFGASSRSLGLPDVDIRTLVRTGDTPQTERASMRRRPPHIVVTTPESLYVLLGSESGRTMLATTRTVIVDEIHALAGNKRGSHLALSLERLAALTAKPPVRIGLSATQKPIEDIARFLVGTQARTACGTRCAIVDVGHMRPRDLALEVPSSPLEAVMSHEVWEQVYARLAELAAAHRTTLVFVNTRRMAERARAICPSFSAPSTSCRITAAWPRSCGTRPSSA